MGEGCKQQQAEYTRKGREGGGTFIQGGVKLSLPAMSLE